jgi:hypothetical protein
MSRCTALLRWRFDAGAVNFSPLGQQLLVVVSVERAIDQTQEVSLGQQALASHLTEKILGKVSNLW